jgi:plastocyanin
MYGSMTKRRTILSTLAASVVGLAGCTGSDGDSNDESGDTNGSDDVTIELTANNEFDPDEVTVPTETTVTWEWASPSHNIAVDSQPDGAEWEGHTSIEDEGFTDEHTFTVAGQYDYHCDPHQSLGMTGTVHVEDE